MPSEAYCELCHVSSSGDFSLSDLSIPSFHYFVCWCLLWCLLSAFRFPCGCHAHHWGAQLSGFAIAQPYGIYSWQAYVLPSNGLWPMPREHLVAFPSTASRREELHASHSAVPHSIYMVGITALRAWQRVTHSLCLPYMLGGSPFPGYVLTNDIVNYGICGGC